MSNNIKSFTLRLPAELHKALVKKSAVDARKLNATCVLILAEGVKKGRAK